LSSLFIRNEEPGQSQFVVWPASESIPAGWVAETRNYTFELVGVEDDRLYDLFIDDLPLEALRSPSQDVARWRWTPGFHAGVVQVRLERTRIKIAEFELTTDPDLRKITRTEFDLMLREILTDTFALFALSSFRRLVARGQGTKPPAIARLEFLRTRIERLVKIIESINENPRRALNAQTQSTPYYQVRSVSGNELTRSFQTGSPRSSAESGANLPQALKGFLPARINIRKRLASYDIKEHRDIKSALRRWSSWLTLAAETLSATLEDDSESKQLRRLWRGRIRKMARSLDRLLQLDFLADVADTADPIVTTSIYKRVPAYRDFFNIQRDISLGIANVFGDFLQMPLARTYELYELWCFLRLLRTSIVRFGLQEKAVDDLFGRGTASNNIVVSRRAVTIPLREDVAIAFQLTFMEYWKEKTGRGSYSRAMNPDIVLYTAASPRQPQRLIVLDAKYRIDASLNEALASIHMYRDALVQETESSGIKDIVSAAYLLSPYIADISGEWKAAELPGRLFHPGYRTEFRFGAVTMRPGMTLEQIGVVLDTILADASVL